MAVTPVRTMLGVSRIRVEKPTLTPATSVMALNCPVGRAPTVRPRSRRRARGMRSLRGTLEQAGALSSLQQVNLQVAPALASQAQTARRFGCVEYPRAPRRHFSDIFRAPHSHALGADQRRPAAREANDD